MKLFVNGCSYSWGGGMCDIHYHSESNPDKINFLSIHKKHPNNTARLQKVYSYHLGKLLKADEVHNISMGGGSNERIVRTTLEFYTNKLLKNEDVTNYFNVIQWTSVDRIEVYDDISKGMIHMLPSGVIFEPDDLSKTFTAEEHKVLIDDILSKKQNIYYKNFMSQQQVVNKTFQQILTLGHFFEKHNIPYLFCSMNPDTIMEYFENYTDKIRYINQFNWLDRKIDKSTITTYVGKPRNTEYLCTSGHPNEKGHLEIANGLHKWIINNKLTGELV
jgi:hypothetical protein